jgi:hypothetical protein
LKTIISTLLVQANFNGDAFYLLDTAPRAFSTVDAFGGNAPNKSINQQMVERTRKDDSASLF